MTACEVKVSPKRKKRKNRNIKAVNKNYEMIRGKGENTQRHSKK